MTAKEMFEKLGYEIDILTNYALGYIRKKATENVEKTITFLNTGTFQYFTIIESDRNNPTISLEELQAINKQVEELGWLDD